MVDIEIDLPDDLIEFVNAQVATGRYVDAGDYIRDLLREHMQGYNRLWDEIDKGLASKVSDLTPEQALDRARERVRSRAA